MLDYTPPCALIQADEPTTEPLRRLTTVLTPRGVVAAQIVRWERELDALDGANRAYIVGMLRELLAEAGT
jgi:hypothetical protein